MPVGRRPASRIVMEKHAEMSAESFDPRFSGVRSLVGGERFEKLRESSVCIVGVGGVGSWAAEALARSGVGALTLVDLDDICVTNINRQLHALSSTVGKTKVQVLAERLKDINPDLKITSMCRFFSATSAEEILGSKPSLVVDCIDRLSNKCLLISLCVERGIPIVASGSAGQRMDPTAIRVTDLAFTKLDPLLIYVRKRLRQRHGFPRNTQTPFGVSCVFSPVESANCDVEESHFEEEPRRSCNSGLGTAAFVTGAFGFAAAAEAVRLLVGNSSAVRPLSNAQIA